MEEPQETQKDGEKKKVVLPSDDDFFKEFEFSPAIKKYYNLSINKDYGDAGEDALETHLKVLAPDHPLLSRFQVNFKEYLEVQIQRLREDVTELEIECKKQALERETIGVEAYETQQLVAKQQIEIDNCINNLQTTIGAREELEYQLEECNKHYKNEKNRLMESERKEIELRNEIESTDFMIMQMSEWEKEIESGLLVNQRIAEKSRKEKIKLAREKKQQDFFLYKLTSEIWKLEADLETKLMQSNVKEDERERLAEAVAMTNIDIEANEADHRCLMHGWNSIITTINIRNKYYNSLNDETKLINEKLDACRVQILQTKRACNKELLKNETLTVFRDRCEQDIKASQRMHDLETEKRSKFEMCISRYDALSAQIEIDKERVKNENKTLMMALDHLIKEVEHTNSKRIYLEDSMLDIINEKSTSLKQSMLLQNAIREMKENIRTLKIQITHIENKVSKINEDICTQKLENNETDRLIEDLQKEIHKEDGELIDRMKEIDKCETMLDGLYRSYEQLRLRLAKYEEDRDKSKYLSPQEFKIKSLEGSINELSEKNKDMEAFWLRQQAIVVDLLEKRQNQIKDINLIKKQILIVDQKNLKITDELEQYQKMEEMITRSINTLQNRLAICTAHVSKKKDSKEALDVVNNKTQNELMEKLEECEFESLKLKAEIVEIEEDKSTLSNELIERNRDALAWEKKIQVANEMRREIHREKGEEGEIGKMRSEIHRMNVRYSHLKKAQEKLMSDLEHCVFRRENIVLLAEARTKYVKGGVQRMRFNFSKKIDDIKNKILQTENDKEIVLRKISMKEEELIKCEERLKDIEGKIKEVNSSFNELAEVIEQKLIDKQLNLDILCYKQRKIKVYSELSRGRVPHMTYRTAHAAQNAYESERDCNAKLRNIVENLLTDFPQHNLFLTKLHNSLVLPAVHL